MSVYQYPALNDNYHFVIHCEETGKCAAVDICDPEPLFDYIEKNNLHLQAVFNTHHHMDHVGGNQKISNKYKNVKFYGSKYDFEKKRIPFQTNYLSEGDDVSVGNLTFNIIEVPGHTLGHICYFNDKYAFVGDTLFSSGCGRLFEGTPEQMYKSLGKIIEKVNKNIPIYCAHEYTLSNLNFSCSLNENYFSSFRDNVKNLRENNKYTVPTTLEYELKANPFLIVHNPELKKNILDMENIDGVKAFAEIRRKKDNF